MAKPDLDREPVLLQAVDKKSGAVMVLHNAKIVNEAPVGNALSSTDMTETGIGLSPSVDNADDYVGRSAAVVQWCLAHVD